MVDGKAAGGGRAGAAPALDLRVDALTGTPVVVTPDRQHRPNLPETACPFCVGGAEAPEPYAVRWFPNRWPPLPGGRAEVLLYGPQHIPLWRLGQAGLRRVVDLWAARTAALAARSDVSYVLVFENRGPQVGATVEHPHGQVYAFAEVPPAPRAELAGAGCALCDPPPPALVVSAGSTWRAWCPVASTYSYELRLAPAGHRPDLPSLDGSERDDLAEVLADALARLDQLHGEPMPYMLWWHQRPCDGGPWPAAHLHAHVAPLHRAPGTPRFVAAGELGSGVAFNPVAPEDAAARLRSSAGAAR